MLHKKGNYCESNYKKQQENPQKSVVKLWKCGICTVVYNSNEDIALRIKNGRKASWVGCDFNAPKQCQYWGHACCVVLANEPQKVLKKAHFFMSPPPLTPSQTKIRKHIFVEQKKVTLYLLLILCTYQ